MKPKVISYLLVIFLIIGCNSKQVEMERIIFLHHSTGKAIWNGRTNKYVRKLTKRSDVKTYINKYNRKSNSRLSITEQWFPKTTYGWTNDPYDYYNIWVKNAGHELYKGEPTLEILTKEFDVIIFKHCYPVTNIQEDTGTPDINSNERRIENYKLQYDALKKKMLEFPKNKFIVWSPSVQVKNNLSIEEAQRAKVFHDWMINEWNEKGDNIFVWDFYSYETEGELFLKDANSVSPDDSHPNRQFSGQIAPLFAQFVIDVTEGNIE